MRPSGRRFETRISKFEIATLLIACVFSGLALSQPDRAAAAKGTAEGNRPYAYLFPAELSGLTAYLQKSEVEVCELREDIELDVNVHHIEQVAYEQSRQTRGWIATLKTRREKQTRRFDAGTVLVKAEQKSGDKVVRLLDPGTRKGRRVQAVLPPLQEGAPFPVMTLDSYVPITQGPVRPLSETRQVDKPITFETIYGEKRPDFDGSPVGGLTWLQDGEHYLQARDGRLYKVHAATGRSSLFVDPNKLVEGLKRLPAMRPKDAESLSKRTWLRMNPDRSAVLIDYENDLYYTAIDGSSAFRLTSSPGGEKYAAFDPQGRFVAFVRDHNLYVVDIATQTERALTTDGGGMIRNGEADWVYFEEVWLRQWKQFWWSPDSSSIAFLQVDDTPVPQFTVVSSVPPRQKVEVTGYPRSGESNPLVRMGIVSAAGGPVRWVDLDEYTPGSYLITGAGWMPDSERIYFFVQDRAQTWLDISTAGKNGGTSKRLLRETTKAWVEAPETLSFMADGSFLLSSERTGWKHFYLYDKAGELKHAVTDGQWEARKVHYVDQADGWVYLSGTRDSHIAEHLYRVKLDGGEVQRLTESSGQHDVNLSPNGKYFIDTWSNASTPPKVILCATDGTKIRTLDSNPVYEREEYRFGTLEQFQIPTSDGFLLEATLLKPPDFDGARRYPVWFTTYGGPHSPTVSDGWHGGYATDQMLAQLGMLVFQCDPRSASGKGACSAWSAYRQLGVQELKDVEEAIAWLKSKPYVNGDRIGMSGHSYGGFLTAYVLAHSTQFAGGIAGAPPTDWRLYDSIYTERYMDTPQNNPDGYDRTSVVKAAANLHGRLLIIHGGVDDNVHMENTLKLVDALQRADKEFQLMVYPESRHGVGGMHYHRLVVNFVKSVLQLPDKEGPK